jgi:hypothetical protein
MPYGKGEAANGEPVKPAQKDSGMRQVANTAMVMAN